MSDNAIFITGASRGIGRATALLLDKYGYKVFAGVRRQSDGDALRSAASTRLQPLILNLLDQATIQQAVSSISASTQKLATLINNVGLAVPAPIEFIPLADLRYQFEVNVFGTTALTQAALPLLRQRTGRIINVSSIAGRITAPLLGAYSASKFALEALTDTLRLELHPQGIQVISIQPGVIATDFGTDALQRANAMLPQISSDLHYLYGNVIAKERARTEQPNRGIPAERVAEVILRALEARHPHTRYAIGPDAHVISFLRSLLPDSLLDRLIFWQR